MLYLEFDNPEKPIFSISNSTDEWYTGERSGFENRSLAILRHDSLRFKPPVHTICIGQAMAHPPP